MFGISKSALFQFMALSLAIVTSSPPAHSGEPIDVRVHNFPETQQIRGSVSIEGTTETVKREGILVPTSRRNELTELVHAGKVDTGGYTSVSVSLQGEIKSTTFSSGAIGVILIPDEEPIMRALREAKQIQFPIENVANIKSGDSDYFSAEQNHQRISFPRYRVYLYNTLNRPAEVNVYLYLKK